MSDGRRNRVGKGRHRRGWMAAFTLAAMIGGIGCAGGLGLPGTCPYENDGECDDGRPCAETSLCDFGTDVVDCTFDTPCDLANSCVYADDGECDDGRPGSVTDLCDPGTDFNDCGP